MRGFLDYGCRPVATAGICPTPELYVCGPGLGNLRINIQKIIKNRIMKYINTLTDEELNYIEKLDLFNARSLAAHDFRKLMEIKNRCYGTNQRANIGCGGCARQLIHDLNLLYLEKKEQLLKEINQIIQEDAEVRERPKRKPRRSTKRSPKQDNNPD